MLQPDDWGHLEGHLDTRLHSFSADMIPLLFYGTTVCNLEKILLSMTSICLLNQVLPQIWKIISRVSAIKTQDHADRNLTNFTLWTQKFEISRQHKESHKHRIAKTTWILLTCYYGELKHCLCSAPSLRASESLLSYAVQNPLSQALSAVNMLVGAWQRLPKPCWLLTNKKSPRNMSAPLSKTKRLLLH